MRSVCEACGDDLRYDSYELQVETAGGIERTVRLYCLACYAELGE